MNKREQAQAVLLCALIDLGGEGSKQAVLSYIQASDFWYQNDTDSPLRPSRPSEKQWRNDIAYARRHMVEKGHIANDRYDCWSITNSGRSFFQELVKKVRMLHSFDDVRFTSAFYNHICCSHDWSTSCEMAAEQLLMDQILNTEERSTQEQNELINCPFPKGDGSKRTGCKTVYYRNPTVSKHALKIAGYRCEIDQTHTSFLCRNLSRPYMEPHHLIPMSMTDDFDVSLDREQNIFCLCSNCHNQIHYGRKEDIRAMLVKLFSLRENELRAILGKNIDIEDLYRIYRVQ